MNINDDSFTRRLSDTETQPSLIRGASFFLICGHDFNRVWCNELACLYKEKNSSLGSSDICNTGEP